MRNSVYNNARAKSSLDITAISSNTTTNSTGIDLNENLDNSRSALIIIKAGAVTDGSYAVTLEESADDSSYTTVAAPDLEGTAPTLTSADANTISELGYLGSKQYIRVSIVSTSVTTGGTFSVDVVRGFVRRPPISHV